MRRNEIGDIKKIKKQHVMEQSMFDNYPDDEIVVITKIDRNDFTSLVRTKNDTFGFWHDSRDLVEANENEQ